MVDFDFETDYDDDQLRDVYEMPTAADEAQFILETFCTELDSLPPEVLQKLDEIANSDEYTYVICYVCEQDFLLDPSNIAANIVNLKLVCDECQEAH